MNENKELQKLLNETMKGKSSLTVLEAGCGSVSHLSFPTAAKIVGIDISAERLDVNTYIHEKIVGDLQTYPLPEKAFDVILCWNVMEHISNPRLVMENFVKSLRDRGVIVLAFPNLYSIKGMVTKLTPFKIHEWFYRYVMGDKRKKDFEQFPTFLRSFIEPHRLKNFVEAKGFRVPFFKLYEGPVQAHWRNKSIVPNLIFGFIGFVSRIVTLNRIDLNNSDCLMVLMKTGGRIS